MSSDLPLDLSAFTRAKEPRTYRDSVRDMTPKTEADICGHVTAALVDEGWDVYPEVRLAEFMRGQGISDGVIDLVAVKGTLAMAVEAKKSFSLELVEQAAEWTKVFPLTAMAVPFSSLRNRSVLKEHLRDSLGLGLFGVSVNHVSFRVSPRLLRWNMPRVPAIKAALDPRMKAGVAGAANTYRHSRFQDFMWYVRLEVAKSGPISRKAIIEAISLDRGTFHYSSMSALRQQLKIAVDSFEADLVEEDGLVRWHPELCPHGEAYVKRIKDIVARGLKRR